MNLSIFTLLLLTIFFFQIELFADDTHSAYPNALIGTGEVMVGGGGSILSHFQRTNYLLFLTIKNGEFLQEKVVNDFLQSRDEANEASERKIAAKEQYEKFKKKYRGASHSERAVMETERVKLSRAYQLAKRGEVISQAAENDRIGKVMKLAKQYRRQGKLQIPRKVLHAPKFFGLLLFHGVYSMGESIYYIAQGEEVEGYIGGVDKTMEFLTSEELDHLADELNTYFEGIQIN